MSLFQMRRRPVFCLFTAAGVVAAHGYLSYPAMIARGYPPISLEDFLAPLLAPFAMALPPFFDDGRNAPGRRLVFVVLASVSFAFIWALIRADTVTPSIGHTHGIIGILKFCTAQVIILTLVYTALSIPFFFCYDRVASAFWGLIRRFPEDQPV